MRRHRTFMTSTTALLVFGLATLSVFATVLAGKNQELDRQRQRAEQREALAIDALKKFRDAVEDNPDLKNRPELDALRKALLQEPLKFFRDLRDRLQTDRDTRPDALTKLADANFDLARTTAEIGSIPDEIRSYTEAMTIWERLAHDHPDVLEYQNDLAHSQTNVGLLLRNTGHAAEALESQRRAMAIRERLARRDPQNARAQLALAASHNSIGLVLGDTGHLTAALVPTAGRWRFANDWRTTIPRSPSTRAISPRAITISASCSSIWTTRPRHWPPTIGRWRSASGWSTTTPRTPSISSTWLTVSTRSARC
jgi:tetratricopeptide (TPR) repeat protein